jgi:hypothetical protein
MALVDQVQTDARLVLLPNLLSRALHIAKNVTKPLPQTDL